MFLGNVEFGEERLLQNFGSDGLLAFAFVLRLEKDDGTDVSPGGAFIFLRKLFQMLLFGKRSLYSFFPIRTAAKFDGKFDHFIRFELSGGDMIEDIGRRLVGARGRSEFEDRQRAEALEGVKCVLRSGVVGLVHDDKRMAESDEVGE